MHPFRKMLRSVSGVIACILILVSVFVFLIRGDIDWHVVINGSGERIPTAGPNESNRIAVASCSIVLPDRWHGKTFVNKEMGYADMSAWPDSLLPRRYGAGFRVTVCPECPNGFTDATARQFEAYSALESVKRGTDGGFENPPFFSYTLLIEVDSTWYLLSYWNFDEVSELPDQVLAYLKTFRVETPTARA